MIEVETQTIEVEVVTNTEVTSAGQVEVETVDLSDLDITVAKKEYVITGDDIYIPMLYDDAPQWMKDLVQVVVDVSISSGNQSLINDMNAIIQDFAVSYVPLNQYTQSIIDLSDEDTRLNGLIETLNSNFNDGLSTANAQIISLQLTKASKDEVVAQVIQTIAAQLADGASNIGSTIGRIDQAIADETSARALSFQVLTSSLEDTNLDVTANANATHVLNTYVGLNNVTGVPNGTGLLADVSAIASDVTTLSTDLQSGAGTWASADSALTNSLSTSIVNGDAAVESKFAYNSVVSINGVYKKSGFGLTTNYISGAGTQANPYVSEFWIDASRLKFTNSNQTGQVAPFTIDATGLTPNITFNGKVSFSNVTNVPQLGSTPQEVVDAVNSGQTTTINGGKITTGSITAAQIQANSVSADKLLAGTNSTTVWTGGGLVSSNFNGNPYGAIGTPTQGFRLSSGAAGTETDPNIYGAYIKGAIVDGSYMKYSVNSLFLTAYNTLAPYVIFSSVNGYGSGLFYFDRLHSPTGAGSDIYRLSKYNQKVTVFGGFAGDFSDIYAAIQYKYDNETDWVTTFTRGINADYRAGVTFSSSFILKPTTYSYIDVRINIYGYKPEASSATLQVSNI